MSFVTKTEIVLICDRCGVGRKFETDKQEDVSEFAVKRLNWKKREDDYDNKVKHYCPNCRQQIESGDEQDDEMRVEEIDEDE